MSLFRRAADATDRLADWENLGRLGRLRIFKSSYFFLLLIPPIARLLHYASSHSVTIPGTTFGVPAIGLPFSWKIFYFSSLFFAIGSLFFTLRCPRLIKDYRNFADFVDQSRSQEQVKVGFIDFMWTQRDDDTSQATMAYVFATYAENAYDTTNQTRQLMAAHLLAVDIPTRRLPDAFARARRLLAVTRWHSRWVCLVSYAVAMILLAWVFVQNASYVVILTFP